VEKKEGHQGGRVELEPGERGLKAPNAVKGVPRLGKKGNTKKRERKKAAHQPWN